MLCRIFWWWNQSPYLSLPLNRAAVSSIMHAYTEFAWLYYPHQPAKYFTLHVEPRRRFMHTNSALHETSRDTGSTEQLHILSILKSPNVKFINLILPNHLSSFVIQLWWKLCFFLTLQHSAISILIFFFFFFVRYEMHLFTWLQVAVRVRAKTNLSIWLWE